MKPMPEYDLSFGAKLATVATEVDEKDPFAFDANRLTLYMSRLSMEITLKALLEEAGMPVDQIRKRSHNLRHLLRDLGDCEVEVKIAEGRKQWVSASRVRAASIDLGLFQLPIGAILDAEDERGSKYPNEIRYGGKIADFKPSFVSAAALVLSRWALDHRHNIRYSPKNV